MSNSRKNSEKILLSAPSQQAINSVVEIRDKIVAKGLQMSGDESKRVQEAHDSYAVVLVIGICLIGTNMHLGDNGYLYYKFIWFLAVAGYAVLFPEKLDHKINTEMRTVLALRLASSSVLYSLLTFSPNTFNFHSTSQREDIVMSLVISMICSLISRTLLPTIQHYLNLQFIIHAGMTAFLMVIFWKFDISSLIHLGCMYGLSRMFYHYLAKNQLGETNINKDVFLDQAEQIKQDLDTLKDTLEEQFSSYVGTISLSEIDDLTKKLRYFKFNLLMNKEEEKPGSIKVINNAVAMRRLQPAKTNSSFTPAVFKGSVFRDMKDLHRLETDNVQISSPSLGPMPTIHSAPKVEEKKDPLKLTSQDCDKIIKLMLERQNITIDFESLKNTGQLGKDTADFLRLHFSEQSTTMMDLFNQYDPSYSDLDSRTFEYSPWSSYLEQNVCDWNFDMLKLKDMTNGKHVVEFGCALIKKFNIMKTLKSDPSTFMNFLNSVSDGYLWNPYHNSIHGADVANGCAYFLNFESFKEKFSDLEIACTLISALVHDIGHPGVNNGFLVTNKSTEAMIYNDQSVLENFHAASFWKILQKQEANIIANLNEKDYRYFRKLSVHIILDTDLTKHMTLTKKFQETSDILNLNEEADRFMSLSICLKCADVAHGTKELSLHKRWSRRILEEFFAQGDREKKAGIPVSPLCGRTNLVAKSQEGFLNFVVKPLFESFVTKFFGDDTKATVLDQIKSNINYWGEEAKREVEGKAEFLNDTQKMIEDIASEQGKK